MASQSVAPFTFAVARSPDDKDVQIATLRAEIEQVKMILRWQPDADHVEYDESAADRARLVIAVVDAARDFAEHHTMLGGQFDKLLDALNREASSRST